MKKSIRNIIAIFIIVVPFYLFAIYEKWMGDIEFLIQILFVNNLFFLIIGLLIIFLINKYLLKNSLKVFISDKGSLLIDVSLAFLILIIIFFIYGIGKVTYGILFPFQRDLTDIFNTLRQIFSNPFYTLVMIGPFIWISEGFLAISRAFILNNLWELNEKKYFVWISIFSTALLFSFTQIDNGIPAMINWFLIFSLTNYIYYKYRRVLPLMLAGIMLQSIEIITAWIYVL